MSLWHFPLILSYIPSTPLLHWIGCFWDLAFPHFLFISSFWWSTRSSIWRMRAKKLLLWEVACLQTSLLCFDSINAKCRILSWKSFSLGIFRIFVWCLLASSSAVRSPMLLGSIKLKVLVGIIKHEWQRMYLES